MVYALHYIDPSKNHSFHQQQRAYINTIQTNTSSGQLDPHPAFTRLFYTLESKGGRIIDAVVESTGKERRLIQPADIMFHLPLSILTEDTDIISQDNLDMIFYSHLYKETSLQHQGKDISIIGEAPWIILNKVIRTAGLPYELMTPERQHIQTLFDDPLNQLNPYQFSAKLIDPKDGTDIGISNLSSGERVIMSLAMLLYYFEYRGLKKSLLILDEIDAHLHPSMTKQFFDVINNVVIKEYGARVIMATHSPSTIALAPAERLYVIKKNAETTTIDKVTKDEALGILTFGVPSLSVSYENRKQVFVESKYDAEYYDQVYTSVKQYLEVEISLNFISSGVGGKGNCDQVIDIVKRLNKAGNKSIYGIIDWDTKNKPQSNICVLGENRRYSIENYIFDPVLLGFFLLREKIVINTELGLDPSEKYLNYENFTTTQLQMIADKILEKLKPRFKIKNETSISEVEFLNGKKINLPDWYTKNYGHDIPPLLMEIFPPLQRFNGENVLRKEIIRKTVPDITGLLSIDLIELFKKIQDLKE